MQVRGAPLIGAVAAFGLALALRDDPSDEGLRRAVDRLARTRPTAVNLHWALERVRRAATAAGVERRAVLAWEAALRLADEDVACNAAIGRHGAAILRTHCRPGRALQLLTHCNAGRLATVAWGTALAPVYRLARDGVAVHVWVGETRPRNQGMLTAWELADAGIDHTVVVDNAGGLLMMRGEVDAVVVGCDRVAANGDVANKVGTYLKALAARDTGVPFYVACPVSTIDPATPEGSAIPIESREGSEVATVLGAPSAPDAAAGDVAEVAPVRVRTVPRGSPVDNPAFDVTPARLVSALLTEHGCFEASPRGVREALAAGGRGVAA